MIKQLLLAGVLGAIALFTWLGLSWAALPFHMQQFGPIPDEIALAGEFATRGMDNGLYYFPTMPGDGASAEEEEAYLVAAKEGPAVSFMAYHPQGINCDPAPTMLKGFIYSLLAALLVSYVLLLARPAGLSYLQRVMVCLSFGVVVALCGPLTFGNFFAFPQFHLFLELMDQVVGWSLAGLVIAAFTGAGRPAAATA